MFEIILKNGMKKVVSYDHRIPTQDTYRNGKRCLDIGQYTTAENIKVNRDRLATHNWQVKWKRWSFREWLLYWMYLWDWVGTKWNNIISCFQESIWTYIERLCVNTKYDKKNNIIRTPWFDKEWYGLFCYSHEKYIVNKVFWYSKEFKYWMLEWLILSDWYIQVEKEKVWKDWYTRKQNVRFVYTSTSEKLIDDIQIS